MILISRSCNSTLIPSLIILAVTVVSVNTGTAIACQAPTAIDENSCTSEITIDFKTSEECVVTEEVTTLKETTEKETSIFAEETTKKVASSSRPYSKRYTKQDAIDIAKVLYRECGGVKSRTEQACVAWTILNSVDLNGTSIYEDIRVPNRYAFYPNTPVRDDLLDLAYDVLERWEREKNGEVNVGRVLPKGYIYFVGDGEHNYFRNKFKGNYSVWDYSLESPYEN